MNQRFFLGAKKMKTLYSILIIFISGCASAPKERNYNYLDPILLTPGHKAILPDFEITVLKNKELVVQGFRIGIYTFNIVNGSTQIDLEMSSSKVGATTLIDFNFENHPFILEVQPVQTETIELSVYPTDDLNIALQKNSLFMGNLAIFSKKARLGYGGIGGVRLKKTSKKKKYFVDWIANETGISYKVPQYFNDLEVLLLPKGKYTLRNSADPDKQKEIFIIPSKVIEIELPSSFQIKFDGVNLDDEDQNQTTEEQGAVPQLFNINKNQ
jgi:hypothetical protein